MGDIDTVDGDASRIDIVKSGNQMAHGGLAAARWPHQGQRFALFDFHGQVVDDRRLFLIVAEGHIFKTDGSVQMLGRKKPFGGVFFLRYVHNFAETPEAGHPFLQLLVKGNQLVNRI